ncbi:hypothetical protein [Salmonella enterica]|uniref:hypothetical protein n=1 Tax=Salmonella enterica TaxID=28901 RepID=UPI001C497453|nr:hypothetical protein [Salmonella enterica]
MLEGYTIKLSQDRDRVLAVQAALEIAKVAVGSDDSSVTAKLRAVSSEIEGLADSIQAAIAKK